MNLLYITFGNHQLVHLQAAYSIYSFLNGGHGIASINVITDSPAHYAHFGRSIHLMHASEEDLAEWKGAYDFFWRIKIEGIKKICALYAGSPVVYLDTDTFFYKTPQYLYENLAANHALMHENEGSLAQKKSKTEKRMWRQVKGKTFGGLAMQPGFCMWNAGVVATPNTLDNQENILALAICDEMCRQGVTRRLIEQFALSVAYQHTYGLVPASHSIAHYWSAKDVWNHHITEFMTEAFLCNYPQQKIAALLSAYDKSAIPVSQKTGSTNRRIRDLAEIISPVKNKVFLSV